MWLGSLIPVLFPEDEVFNATPAPAIEWKYWGGFTIFSLEGFGPPTTEDPFRGYGLNVPTKYLCWKQSHAKGNRYRTDQFNTY